MTAEFPEQRDRCVECQGKILLENGEYVCSKCGLVVSDELMQPEYSTCSYLIDTLGNGERSHSSLGNRLHIVDSLGSYIDYHNKSYFCDSQGQPLSSKNQALFRRLKYNYDLKSRTDKRETDYNALRILNRASVLLRLSDNVRNRAAYYYRKITSSKLRQEISNRLITVATCLFIAVREFKECAPITIQELTQVFRGLGHRVNVRSVVRELPTLQSRLGTGLHVRRSEEYLNRILSSVVVQPEIRRKLDDAKLNVGEYQSTILSIALSIFRVMSMAARGGRNPFILAASTVYAADRRLSQERGTKPVLTQRTLANATGTAEYSLRDHFCSLLKKHCILSDGKQQSQPSVFSNDLAEHDQIGE
ncbi:MAG: hypothetical protein WED05_03555 [Candidatus Atabeyarchaeum deiterrae]